MTALKPAGILRVVNPWGIFDQLVDLVMADGSSQLADRVLKTLLAYSGGHRAAIFERVQGELRLFASSGIDEAALEVVSWAWSTRREDLLAGRPILAAVGEPGPRATPVAKALKGAAWLAILPTMEGSRIVGLLYIDGSGPIAGEAAHVQRLSQLARIGAHAISRGAQRTFDRDAYVKQTPLDEIARDQLLVLLDQHDWNISRVARTLGVTRPTIYNRIERYGIERRRRTLVTKPPRRSLSAFTQVDKDFRLRGRECGPMIPGP